ncbi:hypothetical protein OS493_037481 [Desmophyllum pertusum]|uniref:Uncharacterized protein n=1 Tax=Desmophyllum pertusum TaxID=174260 RepID=A0A9W9Z9H2_9CNID|nr:hypothetical protein OS493_037481 [Desmophyllum pertusum]
MVNLGELKECDEEEFMDSSSGREPDHVAISVDGKYRYIWRNSYDTSFDDNSSFAEVTVEVTVYNEEKICHSHDFQCPSVFLVPVREGVLLLASNDKLELRDFELSRCVRTFSELDSVKRLFPVSEDLVGCLAELDDDCWKVNILSVASAEIVLTTSVQGNAVTSIACNSQFQFVACSREHTSYDDNDNDITNVIIVTVAVWNKRQNLWKRSIITERGGYNASALITRNDDLVVTWRTLDEGAGIHILNATTGTALHSLLTDQHIIDCAFLSDGKHFVCCSSEDQIIRLFNVNSGVLISLIDIETHPYCLAACLNQPLFAVGCKDNEIKLRVHVPEVKDSERKDKRIKLQSY